jgi:hypothetical protein
MKTLLWGITILIIIGIGGFMYRNAVESSQGAVACPVSFFQCPDGTEIPPLAGSCSFPACPPPNVSFPDSNLAFAIPDGFSATTTPDSASIAAYTNGTASTSALIIIRLFTVASSSTPLAVIQQTAITMPSGALLPVGALSSITLGGMNFTVAPIERYDGVVDTAYYLARGTDVLRFDAIDQNVPGWTAGDNLDTSTLPGDNALRQLLGTLQ